MTARVSIARIKVTLSDVEPRVIRRLVVPLSIRLDRLHLTLQAAMGWSNAHLYEFTAGGVGWGVPDPDWDDGMLPANKATLRSVITDTGAKTIHYIYDFGDGWDHVIKIDKIETALAGIVFPLLVAAEGRCPPEDVGGPPGYRDFLTALADPDHGEHDHWRDWCGRRFDLHRPDETQLRRDVDDLARSWVPKPRKPKLPATRT